MESLDNGIIRIEAARHGAELQSIIKNGKEYLWQGDARFWARRSPVLFPIVGKVWNDTLRVNGKPYSMGQHGFARDMDFAVVAADDSSLVYRLESSAESREKFPFDFALEISYRLEGASVVVGWKVCNTGERELPFQIGAHPAFYLPDFDADSDLRAFVRLMPTASPRYVALGEKGCVAPGEHTLSVGQDGLMAIRRSTFDGDAFIFQDSQLQRVELLTRSGKPYISVDFSTPLVALWAPTASKPDCPFICIEPWYGRADAMGYEGEFADREHMQKLVSGACFEATYRINIDE